VIGVSGKPLAPIGFDMPATCRRCASAPPESSERRPFCFLFEMTVRLGTEAFGTDTLDIVGLDIDGLGIEVAEVRRHSKISS
jgi:hypothetical protein